MTASHNSASNTSSREFAFFKNQFVPIEEATISIKTHAFLYGTSIFEGIRGYWLPEERAICIFRMREHYQRMMRNSKIFFIHPTHTLEEYLRTTVSLVHKNQLTTDSYIRPTLYKTGSTIGPYMENGITEFCLWTSPLGQYVDINKGLKVCVSNWRRVDDNAIPPRAKAGGAYMNTALIVTEAKFNGFDEAVVLTHEGTVSEGSAMNLFLIQNGKLITPGKTENILEGITRDAVLTLAKEELGIESIERTIDRTELYTCDEAFFCGTGAQIAPITNFDNRPVGSGEIGPLTRKLQTLYFDVVKNKLPRYQDWCTVVYLDQSLDENLKRLGLAEKLNPVP